MPEIDLPTVIFALVALFVAYKLRSVLGMRQDSERPPGGLLAPLAPRPGASGRACRPARRRGVGPGSAARRGSLEGRRRARPCGLERPRRYRRGGSRVFSPQAFLSGARVAYDMVVHAFAAGDSATLRNLMTPEAFANFDNAIQSPRGCGPDDDDDGRLDRRRHDRRRAARRRRRRSSGCVSPPSSPPSLATPKARSSTDRQAPSPIISTCGLSRATFARAIPTGC